MQPHLLSLTIPPTILEKPIIGSIQTCIIIRNIGSSIAVRIPSLNQYGIVSSTHFTDEAFDDIQQMLSTFTPGQKLQ
jgi:hypothetical protein